MNNTNPQVPGITQYTTPDGHTILRDTWTGQSIQLDPCDVRYSHVNVVQIYLDRLLSYRRDIIRFFASMMRRCEWAEDYPRIFLFGSVWGPKIARCMSRAAEMTGMDFPDARMADYIPDWYDSSWDWMREHIGVRYAEYKMNSDIRGWRTYTEEEFYVVEEAMRRLCRVRMETWEGGAV